MSNAFLIVTRLWVSPETVVPPVTNRWDVISQTAGSVSLAAFCDSKMGRGQGRHFVLCL